MRKNNRTHLMAGVFLLIFSVVFLVIMGRFVYIQAKGEIDNVSLKEWAQEKREVTHTLNAERGKIFDNNGTLLAFDRTLYRVYAIVDESYSGNSIEPKHVSDPEETAKLLAPFLNLKQGEIIAKIDSAKKAGRFQIEFGDEGKN